MRIARYIILIVLLLVLSNTSLGQTHNRTRSKNPRAETKQSTALTSSQIAVINEALKSLRKMAAATEIGIAYRDYRERLIDAKAEVDNAATALPDGDLKKELNSAIQVYIAVAFLWDKYIKFQSTEMMIGRRQSVQATIDSMRVNGEKITPELEESLQGFLAYDESAGEIARLVKDYSIPTEKNGSRSIIWPKDIFGVWNAARSHIKRASDLLSQH